MKLQVYHINTLLLSLELKNINTNILNTWTHNHIDTFSYDFQIRQHFDSCCAAVLRHYAFCVRIYVGVVRTRDFVPGSD